MLLQIALGQVEFETHGPGAGFGAFAALAFLIGIATTIFWMVIGWRAMRAHEDLVTAVKELGARGHESERP